MGITLVLSTCAMLALCACTACLPSQMAQPNESPAHIYNAFPATGGVFGQFIWPMVTACLSLVTNITATSLIGYQAWRHRQITKPLFSKARAEKALLLLVESGILYCVLSALGIYHHGMLLGYWGESTQALGGLTVFMAGALVPLLGICPTAIIVVLALSKSLSKTQSSLTIPTIRFTPQDSGPYHGNGSEGEV
ncbi:hypothetical protein C8Q74DRAFT_1282814 [Fomes fomentarius]|nr:hypothetical protein C8Q74DRAFT_1282814 [Fomes fomentarius]